MRAILALEDGSVFEGQAVGARASACGEVCFNTSMTGYQEILTDPSYRGQIVTMTYPEIGNYGVNTEDIESGQPHVAGFVMRELSPVASSWRQRLPLNEYLELNGVPGIEGIDTRLLTKKLRVRGALNGFISTEGVSLDEAREKAANWPGLEGVDYVKEVTHKESFKWDDHGIDSHAFRLPNGNGNGALPDLPAAEIPIVAYDFGIKYNILRCLRQHGFDVTVVPATTTAQEVMNNNPAGIFLSNGPGDPAALGYAVEAVSDLLKVDLPVFGICLGHQILGQALGGQTFKLKFGHRGANHPVKDLESGAIEITSQNHGFSVDPGSLPNDIVIDRINLNDDTVEGLSHRTRPIFSVQYHPEASPGPHDASQLFRRFRDNVTGK
jgi:carbamoyl-phosphate synthase small subunit